LYKNTTLLKLTSTVGYATVLYDVLKYQRLIKTIMSCLVITVLVTTTKEIT